jgi:outer membrane immunogenic protein
MICFRNAIACRAALMLVVGLLSAPAMADGRAPIWSGAYVGGSLGGAFGQFKDEDFTKYWTPNTTTTRSTSLVGGLHAGYNWQWGSVVWGIEADGAVNAAKLSSGSISQSSPVFGGFRGRLGYALGSFLVYGGLGLNYSRFKADYAAAGKTSHFDTGNILGGVTVGVEYAISDVLIARLEAVPTGGLGHIEGHTLDYRARIVRTGLSVKF